jgi:hypothetical protein
MARASFVSQIQQAAQHYQVILQQRRKARLQAEQTRARRLLVKAALVEIALGRNMTLWDERQYPSAFSKTVITGLQRHGYPWGALLQLSYDSSLTVEERHPFFQEIQKSGRESLKGRFSQFAGEAKRQVKILNQLQQVELDERGNDDPIVQLYQPADTSD